MHCPIISENIENHATLKSSKSITKTKWHSPEGKSTKKACECGLVLILRCYEDLGIARISIQKAIVTMSS